MTPAQGPEELFRRFEELGITHETVRHEAVFTVEEAKALRGDLQGGHSKNLFLRNKKGAMWLVVCREDLRLDLRALGQRLGAGRFSFGSPRRLMEHLGVIPGAVSPFAVINDKDSVVRVIADRALLKLNPLHFHPLDNAMTTTIVSSDLLRFLEAEGHRPRVMDLP